MTYGVIWSALMKFPGARAFRTVVMAAVAVVIAQFYAAIIVAARQVVEASCPGDVVLIPLIGLGQIRFGEIVNWLEKRCCMAE